MSINQKTKVIDKVKPVPRPYIPDRCDIIHCEFQVETNLVFQRGGHSLKGPHYAVVLSPYNHNKLTNLAFICPITSTIRKFKGEIEVPEELGLAGVFRVDQFTTIDYAYQKATHYNNLKAPIELIEDILEILGLMINHKF